MNVKYVVPAVETTYWQLWTAGLTGAPAERYDVYVCYDVEIS
jgi:hypothetical protein